MKKTFWIIYLLWNIFVFSVYGIDKYKAVHKKWRISESALLLCAFAMGGAGAYAGMSIFRHKTKKAKFKIAVPLCMAVNLAVIYALYSAL